MPAHVHVPPELLYVLEFKRNVLRSLYLLPSLMYRIESLMLSSQLREEIDGQTTKSNINSSLVCSWIKVLIDFYFYFHYDNLLMCFLPFVKCQILEAITTMRCSESFSMERLELLGDSVLKYVVSCHLFLKYPKKHEGQLSARRSLAVRNSTLHKFALERKLQVWFVVSSLCYCLRA